MRDTPRQIGNRLAPARFILFILVFALAAAGGAYGTGDWRSGLMAGFDIAALGFLASCLGLFRRGDAETMRRHARENDANRIMMLVITGAVTVAVFAAVAAELLDPAHTSGAMKGLIVATLILAWLFSNTVYALHYAHLAYLPGRTAKGLDFPGTKEPDYWDFVYFAFTLGMTFQTSDVAILDRHVRRTVTWHSVAAFVFNLGVLAFTVNVLGS
jgi:uncharacterized membrane protein